MLPTLPGCSANAFAPNGTSAFREGVLAFATAFATRFVSIHKNVSTLEP